MTRNIDADELKKENERLLHCDFPYLSEITLEELIDEAPTVDAVPVKHGKWLWLDGVRCSQCNYKLATTGLPLYCPSCGADMRKEE